MASAALAMLADSGRLAFDAPVTTYLPSLQMSDPAVTREVTVRDIVAHRTGLARGEPVWMTSGVPPAEIVRRLRYFRPSWSFRSQFGYSNIMYIVAGEVLASAAGSAPRTIDVRGQVVAPGMRDGAFGVSTGLIYIPGTYSNLDEVLALAGEAGRAGGIYTSHLRGEGLGLLEGVAEALEIGRRARVPVVLTHHKAVGPRMWGQSVTTLRMVDSARAAGTDVMVDQYPYTAASTTFDVILPPWALAGGRDSLRARLEAVVPLVIEGYFNGGAAVVLHLMDEGDVRRIMAHPTTMIASDGRLSVPGNGVPHPRNYGTFPRVLGEYVRAQRVLTLEEAVRKMTAMPAARLGLTDRGCLRVGCAADVVVFDPATVRDRATFLAPHQYREGIPWVFVNGVAVVADGVPTGATAGEAGVSAP
nr:serine hydrolase [Gemmatimonas sp.]